MNAIPGTNQLIGLSFDMPSSPKLKVRQVHGPHAASGMSGWGLAWYPPEDRACVSLKDPSSEPADPLTRVLGDWQRFRSTIFVCHLRGAASRVAQEDTQPFDRSFGGRDYVAAHNGQLEQGYQNALSLGNPPLYEPVGHTDTEHFLCWILHRLFETNARSLAGAGWPVVHGWLRQINGLGTLNVLLADADHLVAYQDGGGFNRLHWMRNPPTGMRRLENDAARLDMGGPRDNNRTAVIVATQPMTRRGWQQLGDGQMLVMSRGAVVWNSAEAPAAPLQPPPLQYPAPAEFNRITTPYSLGIEPAAHGQSMVTAAPAEQAALTGRKVYQIEHVTRYKYATAVESSTHMFRLKPVHDVWQQLLSYDLQVSPQGQIVDFEDVFGNEVRRMRLNERYNSLEIRSRSTVEILAQSGVPLRSTWRRSTIPLVWMPWQRQMMTPYLLPPELPESQLQELFDYAMSFVERQDYDLIESITDLNQSIYRDYSYVQGVTTMETTPFEVFTSRKGVCQDFANLFICLARLLHIPARYRVGYIYTGAQYENKVQSDASHAWVEVYLPWIGWRGFDPTNGCLVGGDHVRVACGRNYRDATPTAGTLYRGGDRETLTIDVRVTPAEVPPGLPAGSTIPAARG